MEQLASATSSQEGWNMAILRRLSCPQCPDCAWSLLNSYDRWVFDELHGALYFSKLELLYEYHKIRVRTEDIEKTTFRTHDGYCDFSAMQFGLSNSPSTFQSTINNIFRHYLRCFMLVLFDDILVYSPDWIAHLDHFNWFYSYSDITT